MSRIEWTDATWNPTVGCSPVSPGCLNCYAATMAGRLAGMAHSREVYADLTVKRQREGGGTRRVFNGTARCLPDRLAEPLTWRTPRMVFVDSMSDLFHEDVPFDFIDQVFAVMALCPQHTFQVLTKRPERMAEYLGFADRDRRIDEAVLRWHEQQAPDYALSNRLPVHPLRVAYGLRVRGLPSEYRWPLRNVWIGTSTEDQPRLEERVGHLLRCPAAVRFLSCEPLLGQLTFNRVPIPSELHGKWKTNGLHWVIAGGESGPGARPCNVAWIRGIVEQCREAGVACFVKQLGACIIAPDDALIGKGRTESEWGTALYRWFCDDPKGGDPDEWPEDLREIGRAHV